MVKPNSSREEVSAMHSLHGDSTPGKRRARRWVSDFFLELFGRLPGTNAYAHAENYIEKQYATKITLYQYGKRICDIPYGPVTKADLTLYYEDIEIGQYQDDWEILEGTELGRSITQFVIDYGKRIAEDGGELTPSQRAHLGSVHRHILGFVTGADIDKGLSNEELGNLQLNLRVDDLLGRDYFNYHVLSPDAREKKKRKSMEGGKHSTTYLIEWADPEHVLSKGANLIHNLHDAVAIRLLRYARHIPILNEWHLPTATYQRTTHEDIVESLTTKTSGGVEYKQGKVINQQEGDRKTAIRNQATAPHNAEIPTIPLKELTDDEITDYVQHINFNRSEGIGRGYGEHWFAVSLPFAVMGSVTALTKTAATLATDLTFGFLNFFDKEARETQAREWRKGGGMFGWLRRRGGETAEHVVREHLADWYIGLTYTHLKEMYMRQVGRMDTPEKYAYVMDRAFRDYNLIGELLYKAPLDYLKDLATGSTESGFNQYRQRHAPDTPPSPAGRVWNYALDLVGYGFERTTQVLTAMTGATRAFGYNRQHAREQIQESSALIDRGFKYVNRRYNEKTRQFEDSRTKHWVNEEEPKLHEEYVKAKNLKRQAIQDYKQDMEVYEASGRQGRAPLLYGHLTPEEIGSIQQFGVAFIPDNPVHEAEHEAIRQGMSFISKTKMPEFVKRMSKFVTDENEQAFLKQWAHSYAGYGPYSEARRSLKEWTANSEIMDTLTSEVTTPIDYLKAGNKKGVFAAVGYVVSLPWRVTRNAFRGIHGRQQDDRLVGSTIRAHQQAGGPNIGVDVEMISDASLEQMEAMQSKIIELMQRDQVRGRQVADLSKSVDWMLHHTLRREGEHAEAYDQLKVMNDQLKHSYSDRVIGLSADEFRAGGAGKGQGYDAA